MFTLSFQDIATLNRVRARIAPSPVAFSFEARREQIRREATFNRSIRKGYKHALRVHHYV